MDQWHGNRKYLESEVERLTARVRELEAACQLLDQVDCCTGYTFPDADWPKFWAALEAARDALAKGDKP